MPARAMTARALLVGATALWLGYIGLLLTVPTLFPPDPTLPNVAARSGYNTALAYWMIALWSALGLIFFAWYARTSSLENAPPPLTSATPQRYRWVECFILAALVFLLYCPPLLALRGHYIEDIYFLNVLARMQCGQLPYSDFEFLYGPLMIYPAHFWINSVGYSLQSYYWLLALMQASLFALTLWSFQIHVGERRARYLAFVVFAPFIIDSLLGLNYMGWRVLPIIAALMAVAAHPTSYRMAALAGSLIGIQLAYSFEYGIIAYIAVAAVYGATQLHTRTRRSLSVAATFVVIAPLLALLLIRALTDSNFSDFFAATAHTLHFASATGLGNFPFYWTLNSLALFALLSIAVVVVGSGLLRLRQHGMNYGDRLLLGALLFAIGGLRIAIQRADIWHLTLPFIPLLIALLWQTPRQLFRFDARSMQLVWILIVIASVTRGIGLMPTGSFFVAGLLNGAKDMVSGKTAPALSPNATRRHSVQSEFSERDPDILALGQFLATPDNTTRAVFFYNELWWMPAHVGVCPSGYSFYQQMYTDGFRPISAALAADPNALALIHERTYKQQFEGIEPPAKNNELSITKRIGAWTSSIHEDQKVPEGKIKSELWRQNVGNYLVQHYERREQFGEVVVLVRKSTTPTELPLDASQH